MCKGGITVPQNLGSFISLYFLAMGRAGRGKQGYEGLDGRVQAGKVLSHTRAVLSPQKSGPP